MPACGLSSSHPAADVWIQLHTVLVVMRTDIVHVSRGANIHFSLAEASFRILFSKRAFASNRTCDRCPWFFSFCFFSPLVWNVDRFEVGEFTNVTQTRLFVMVWLAGWRHRKLYVYIAASFLVCPGWFLCCCVTPGGNRSTLTFLPFDLILLLWYLWADATYLFYRPYCVKHRVLIFIKGLFFLKKKGKKTFCA